MRTFVCALLALPFSLNAQDTRGGCSITLISDVSTTNQGFCVDPVNATIEPIVYILQGTGLQVTDLPPGVTATFVNDTLTIAGTISSVGIWHPHVALDGACVEYSQLVVAERVDMQLSCTVVNDSVMLAWPGVNALSQDGGTFFIYVLDGADLLSTTVIFTPCPDYLTIGDLPPNIPLTFQVFLSGGFPTCTTETAETTCTIIGTSVSDQVEGTSGLRTVPIGDLLRLSSSTLLREVRIYAMLGDLVAAYSVNTHTANLPIGALASGSYVLRVVDEDGRVAARRFVKD